MRIEIVDTTLRDGQQSPLMFDAFKYRFSLEEKKLLVKGLIELGVSCLEFFSPVVSKTEKEDFIEIKKYVKKITKKKILFMAHCRCHPDDINEAIAVGFTGLHLYIGTSEESRNSNHGKNLDEIIALVEPILKNLRDKYPKLYLRFSGEDSFRTKLSDLFKVYDPIVKYVNTLGMPDTVGIANPEIVAKRIKAMKKRYPNTDLECHFHNDCGLAIINALTAIKNGVKYVDTTIWGISERSGIPSVTSLLFNLFYINPELVEGYNLEVCYPLNVLLGSIMKMHVPWNEPVSLTNRTHTAGVHQKAVLKNEKVYEGHDLEKFGVTKGQILLGPLSGWNLIQYYLREVKNLDITMEQAKEVTKKFKSGVSKIHKGFKAEKFLLEIVKDYNIPKIKVPKDINKKRVEILN